MAMLNISAAARAAGKDRETIRRYLKNGRLSCVKDEDGRVTIDTAELLRVFGELVTDGKTGNEHAAENAATKNGNIPHHSADVEELLRQQLAAAAEREKWYQARIEKLENERRALPQGETTPKKKKGILSWLFE